MLDAVLTDRLHERGPMTVAAFMELALYHPSFGYYARASRRSGAAGDFFTSVDTGPLFGRLLARQVADMAARLDPSRPFTLVDAGAGDGRLARDILQGLQHAPSLLDRTHAWLVERSDAACIAQRQTLEGVRVAELSSSATLPSRFEGVLIANELLDAMPAHLLVMRAGGLREVYVAAEGRRLTTHEGPASSPDLAAQLARSGVTLPQDARAEVSLAAVEWTRAATRALTRGFLVLIDYGHEARVRYGEARAAGTLSTFRRHRVSHADPQHETWLQEPGMRDITADVDFTAVRQTAEDEGCTVLGFMDQTYFLMALTSGLLDTFDERDRRACKTLIMPGGLGSTMKVLILGKDVGWENLIGCSGPTRVT